MTTNELPAIGTRIEASRPADSFYSKVRGNVTGFRNGFIQIEADEVVSKWGKGWQKHPTRCSMGIKLADIIG